MSVMVTQLMNSDTTITLRPQRKMLFSPALRGGQWKVRREGVDLDLDLGLVEEAKSAGAVLGHNYPGSDWYANSYAMLTESGAVVGGSRDSWYSRAYRQVIKGEWL